MFTWICPQCGGEVLPSQEECPRCVKPAAAPQQPTPVSAPTPAPAPVPVLAPQPVAAPQPAPVFHPPAQPQPMSQPQPAPRFEPQAEVQAHARPSAYSYDAPPEPRSTGLRDTLVTLGVAAVLLGGGYLYWTRGERAADHPAAESKPGLESVKGAKSTHPLAKQIEVTGIRVRMQKTGQADIHFLVVNHSAAEITNLSMDVAFEAKGVNKEVALVSTTVKKLAPFGSAEVSVKGKSEVSALDMPDWQFIEPQVVIHSSDQ